MLAIIYAISLNCVIGKGGRLPWSLPSDLRHFRELTVGHKVIMGRKTFESLPERYRPLPGRQNIVLSRTMKETDGIAVCRSWEEVLKLVGKEEEAFVIGGREVFKLALPVAKRLYRTLVFAYCSGDVLFPNLNEGWELIEDGEIRRGTKDQYSYSFQILQKVR